MGIFERKVRIENIVKNDENVVAWNILKKHFTEHDGLFDQIEHGRIISVKFGAEPETCRELQDIQRALQVIGSSMQSTVPKWQISLLLSVEPRIQEMIRRMPAQSLVLHTLHAKLFTWFLNVLHDSRYEPDSSDAIENSIARGFSNVSLDLRLFDINRETFAELLQTMNVFMHRWQDQSSIPRFVAQHFVEVPIMDWNAQWYHRKNNKEEIEKMKQKLLACIEKSLVIEMS